MMSDPTIVDGEGPARGARAAVARLAPEFGVGLPVDVEAALYTPTGVGGDRYLDPIALVALFVSAAQLAWSVYVDLRKRTAQPAPQVVARRVRVELAERTEIAPGVRDRVIDIVSPRHFHPVTSRRAAGIVVTRRVTRNPVHRCAYGFCWDLVPNW